MGLSDKTENVKEPPTEKEWIIFFSSLTSFIAIDNGENSNQIKWNQNAIRPASHSVEYNVFSWCIFADLCPAELIWLDDTYRELIISTCINLASS